MNSQYLTSAAKAEQLPPFELPELAFFGRSNTGKSSLLNTLLSRKNLARQSRTPGRTQMVNFFSVNDQLILADLPGYGYSEARRDVVKHWQALVDAYVLRPNIREFFFLLDSRRQLTDEDVNLMYFLSKQLPLRVVLTKSDKLSRAAIQKQINELTKALEAEKIGFYGVYPTSTLKKTGIQKLWDEALAPYLDQGKTNP